MIQTSVIPRRTLSVPRAVASVLVGGTAIGVVVRGFQYYGGRAARHHLETAWIWFLAAVVLFVWSARPRTSGAPIRHAAQVPALWLATVTIPAALLLYLPALRVGFLSDDFVLAARAAQNDFFHAWTELFRPVPLLVFRGLGSYPAVLHTFNVVLHGLNAALVARLAVRFGSRGSAYVAAALFLAFPASVEAVVWCSGVQDLLMTTLTLTTLDVMTSRVVLSTVPLAAALLTKETAVATPILAALASPRSKRGFVLASLLVLAYVCWRVVVRPLPETYAVGPSAYAIKEMIVRAFGTLALPVHARALQGTALAGGTAALGYVALVLDAAWRRSDDRHALAAPASLVAWILASVAPVYSYFFITGDLAGSRYLYLASAGWSVLLAMLMTDAASRVGLGAAVLVCAAMAGTTRINIRSWTAAAATRDQVLKVVGTRLPSGCPTVWVDHAPDSVDGAYVFRNGLAEALMPLVLDAHAPEPCRVDALE
jgi:hypothetical protein